MAIGSGRLVPNGSDSWGRRISKGTAFPSYQPTKPNTWNDVYVFSSSYLIRKRTPDDAGTIFLFILPVIKLTARRSELPSSWVYYSTLL